MDMRKSTAAEREMTTIEKRTITEMTIAVATVIAIIAAAAVDVTAIVHATEEEDVQDLAIDTTTTTAAAEEETMIIDDVENQAHIVDEEAVAVVTVMRTLFLCTSVKESSTIGMWHLLVWKE